VLRGVGLYPAASISSTLAVGTVSTTAASLNRSTSSASFRLNALPTTLVWMSSHEVRCPEVVGLAARWAAEIVRENDLVS